MCIRDRYGTEFELVRLEFSIFGSIKNMEDKRKIMMCCGQVLVRKLIGVILLNPAKINPELLPTAITKGNLKTLASMLYYLCMDVMKEVPSNSQSQDLILNGVPIDRKGTIADFRNNPNIQLIDAQAVLDTRPVNPNLPPTTQDNIIHGLISKPELGILFFEHQNDVTQLLALIKETCKVIADGTTKFWVADYRYNSGQDEVLPEVVPREK
eukprot:TRINITY_DN5344_c0_g1_i7.p2 TRINITY_DN5344_c0_g1~~TRINITY_DN5344_c0_g1_i7.p2  ORF type:complete len:211 (-),score=45.71 TRINITY_DN5344_c0_g1_i7:346-978(-)